MKLSHSKLQTILNNPMDYYLGYELGIKPKETKPYFLVGSAVHWGLENNTSDLDGFFESNPSEEAQFQAEAMVEGFYYHKEEVMKEIFKDPENPDKQLKLKDDDSEFHELDMEVDLPSFIHPDKPHTFVGIIDLLFLTEKGFIICDYKTSSALPEFKKYLDQLYRYIYMLKVVFPDTPVVKIAIINIVKSKIKRLKNESEFDFKKRYREQYEKDYNHLINVHCFDPQTIESSKLEEYITNLSREADLADSIVSQKLYHIDYSHIEQPYPSVYLDIYKKEFGNFLNYTIKDYYYDFNDEKLVTKRNCNRIDMMIINDPNHKIINKYQRFKEVIYEIIKDNDDEKSASILSNLKDYLIENYVCDPDLIDNYIYIFTNKLDKDLNI